MTFCRALMTLSVAAGGAALVALALRLPWPVYVAGGLVLAVRGRKRLALFAYGTARYAAAPELERFGLLRNGPGLGVGVIDTGRPPVWGSLRGLFSRCVPARVACERFMLALRKLQPQDGWRAVRLNSSVHLSVFAPTGVGKGTTCIIPFLRSTRASVCVIDPKAESVGLCLAQMQLNGLTCHVLDPFRVSGRTDCLNPVDLVAADDPLALNACQALAAEMVVVGTEPDQHWNAMATKVIAAALAVIVLLPVGHPDRCLNGMRKLLADPARFQQMIQMMVRSDAWAGLLARQGHILSGLKDKELGSVLSTVHRHTAFVDTLPIIEVTSRSTFDPRDLTKSPVGVFLVLPPSQAKAQEGFLRLMIGTIIRACMAGGLQEANTVTFVLDEAASLGQMSILEEATAVGRGYGIRLQYYYQSLGQLKTVWRDGLDQSLLSNTTQVYFGINDYQTAEAVSDRLGEYTLVVEGEGDSRGTSDSRSTTDGTGSVGGNRGTSRNFSQAGRKLARPEELLAWPKERCLSLVPGLYPVVTTLIPYYAAPRPPTRWRAIRRTAEVWLAAVALAVTASGALWLSVSPASQPPAPAARGQR